MIRTKLDGTLRFHTHTKQYESKWMKKWISGRQKTNTKDCEQSPKGQHMKHDDGMTTSSHARDTAGGRGIFSNAQTVMCQ